MRIVTDVDIRDPIGHLNKSGARVLVESIKRASRHCKGADSATPFSSSSYSCGSEGLNQV